mgnify:CR=1 FL=1
MLTLYHHNISVCAQKVRIAFDEKRLAYEGKEIDLMAGEHLEPAFLAINPKGLVPVLIHDGETICESTVILEYIEDVFPQHPLRPAAPVARARMRTWTKVPDEGLHIACASVTYASAFVHQLRAHHDRKQWQERIAKLPDRFRAPRQKQILEFSLADVAIIPYVTRLERLGLDGMWADRPHVARWFEAVRARPSFDTAITAFRSNAYDDELKKHGINVWPLVERLLAA